METLLDALRWLASPSNWEGPGGIPARTWEHVTMTLYVMVLASAVGFPLGLLIGHARRGEGLAAAVASLGRAIPSFGILAFVFPFTLRYLPGIGFWPTFIALFLLAVPPILTNSYVGVAGVDADTLEAARGTGMSERQVLFGIEVPLAAPLIVTGLRTAAVQVVATATLGAVIGWGGLGRYIIDGFGSRDNGKLLGGAILVALLAILTEMVFALLQRAAAPRVSSRRTARRPEPAPAA